MKLAFFSFLFTVLASSAYALEQCSSTSTSELVYKSDTLKITFIQGDIAKQAWNQMAVDLVEPESEADEIGYNTKAKYSENLKCWNYQPRKYLDGAEVGASDCDAFSCNVIERK